MIIQERDCGSHYQYYIKLDDGRFIHKSARKSPDGTYCEFAKAAAKMIVQKTYDLGEWR